MPNESHAKPIGIILPFQEGGALGSHLLILCGLTSAAALWIPFGSTVDQFAEVLYTQGVSQSHGNI
ncbi:hypothetical protein [Bifidobacterium pseudocatenulatum]|uniref:hypothetical protein n=1 Tax=Bifidobacterium pseudocatenulatum TaxID=28026 RepID=UPI0031E77C94